MGIKNTLIGLSVVCMMVPSFAASAEAKGSADQKEMTVLWQIGNFQKNM